MTRKTLNRLLPVALGGALALTGCGTDAAVSDRLVENQGAEAFLDQVQNKCGTLYLGNNQIRDLLDGSVDDTYFIDETSKLYFGKVDKQGYSGDINAFYPADRNKKALDCIFQQLDN